MNGHREAQAGLGVLADHEPLVVVVAEGELLAGGWVAMVIYIDLIPGRAGFNRMARNPLRSVDR